VGRIHGLRIDMSEKLNATIYQIFLGAAGGAA